MKKSQLFHKGGIGFQLSPLTDLQKSYAAPGLADGGREYTSILVVDELVSKGEAGHEFQVFVNKTDLRIALLEALQRGDPRIRYNDAMLIDNGRIRKSVAEALYPDHSWNRGTEGGEEPAPGGATFRKSQGGGEKILRDAFGNYIKNPGADLKTAAAELDALVERYRRG